MSKTPEMNQYLLLVEQKRGWNGIARVWVLIMKIQPEKLELYEERGMRSIILAIWICAEWIQSLFGCSL